MRYNCIIYDLFLFFVLFFFLVLLWPTSIRVTDVARAPPRLPLDGVRLPGSNLYRLRPAVTADRPTRYRHGREGEKKLSGNVKKGRKYNDESQPVFAIPPPSTHHVSSRFPGGNQPYS